MSWQRMTWIGWRTPLHAFMNTAQSSRKQVFERIFHYHDNIPCSTTLHWFDFTVLRMAFVRRLQSQSISELLRSHGAAQTGIWLLAKCWLQTSGLINWLLHGLTSATAACLLASVPHVSLHWYIFQYIYIWRCSYPVSSLSTTGTSLAPEPDDENLIQVQVTTSTCDEDPLKEAEPDTNAQPGVRLAVKPSQ
jgi:hypothetical protein